MRSCRERSACSGRVRVLRIRMSESGAMTTMRRAWEGVMP